MKRRTKIAGSTIIIVLIILIGVGIFLIKPEKEVDYFDKSKVNASDSNLLDTKALDLKNFSLNLSIDETKLNTLIAANNNVHDFKAQIENNNIVFYQKVNLIGSLNSQYKMVFDVGTENNNIVLALQSAQIGKIKISNSTVMKELKNHENDLIYIDEAQSKIILKLQKIKINEAKVEGSSIKIKVDLREYIKNNLGILKDLFK
ncbi:MULTISPECIES: hypothetical protein [Clostridium]|uniref:Uncharacterized protein n=1 Tax=Clostridium manihotivorum TaxID=2320868 RepID=A0A3R5QXR6_9CLOT|nr:MULTISPECIES: hypothetical protein [Clostridium]QAA34771.1 hypothetical protein C1I91_25775 [Clostridium manihotivorum]